jgi:hypothetical protein
MRTAFVAFLLLAPCACPPKRDHYQGDGRRNVSRHLPVTSTPSPGRSSDRGTAPPNLPMERMRLVIRRRAEQDGALQKFMDGQLDESSPNFHTWLAPEQFGDQFGRSGSLRRHVVARVARFEVARVSNGRTVVEFRARQVKSSWPSIPRSTNVSSTAKSTGRTRTIEVSPPLSLPAWLA